ncbi:MAG: peptidylprolyl isomerase [Planctomycetota bacterium]|nr:peptidylprolyl isomerase [Planctomycetota bacterium]
MLNFLSRRSGIAKDLAAQVNDLFGLETLEPRIVFDGTPADAGNPVVEISTDYGNIYIELFPDVAPVTVENFIGYVERGDYDGTFFHRHVQDFILQGGGWTYDQDRIPRTDRIEQQDTIVNEFNLSNLEWTVAMAKLSGDPDSASSEWFINLGNNASNLDNQNGGFTVFGEVVGGRNVVDAITDLRVVNLGSGFETLPVTESFDPQGSTVNNEDLVNLNSVSLVFDPDLSLTADTTVSPSGTATGANVTTVVLESGFDRAIAFKQVGLSGGWTVTDLNLKADQSGKTSTPVTWIDPKDGLTYAAATSDNGLLLYKNTSGTTWTVRNLSNELNTTQSITGNLTVFVSQGRKAHIAGLTDSGDVILFNQTGASSNGEYTWTARNLSETDLLVNNINTTPAFTGQLTSYVTSWNALNVVGLDANGDIQAVWWSPNLDAWTTSNLSDITGAPPMQGAIAPYLTTWNAINLTGTDADGNVVVSWWVPKFKGDWVQSNLTDLYSGPQLEAGSVATWVTPWGGTNILGRNINGDVVVYWWAPNRGPGQWRIDNLSQVIEGAEVPTGPIVGFSSPSGVVNIFGAADDGELIRYWWRATDGWQWENVSSTAQLT